MRKFWRYIAIIVSLLLVILIVMFIWASNKYRASLPVTSGTFYIDGIQSDVEVYYDEWGIPHIFAENEKDLFFVQGYVTAQNRLWQMDLSRRLAYGELSEIVGDSGIGIDRFFKMLGLHRMAEKIAPTISGESRLMLESYAAGVNSFIENNSDKMPLEFTLLQYKPDTWTIEHSLAYLRMMGWSLSMGWYVDPALGMLEEKVGTKMLAEIMPGYEDEWSSIISGSKPLFSSLHESIFETVHELQTYMSIDRTHPGSNSWVVSGEKTVSGKPILANDPHLGLRAPSVWYEAHLSCPGIEVYGVTLPGLPGIVIGHNRSYGWGLTNVMADDIDFFVERIDPEDSLRYEYKGAYRKFKEYREVIRVKHADSIDVVVKESLHGPIISDIHSALKGSDRVVSMRWSGHDVSDEYKAYYKIMKGKNRDEFLDGLRHYQIPPQNFVYADTAGHIGYWCAGAIPIRKKGRGQLPLPGWSGEYDWCGYIPFDELPHLYDPPEKYIGTANNKIVNDSYPYYITSYWEPPYRASRIYELLRSSNDIDIEFIKMMQYDRKSHHAMFLMPYIRNVIDGMTVKDEMKAKMVSDFAKWNMIEDPELHEPSIFHVFLKKLYENIYKDEMGIKAFKMFKELTNIPIRATDRLIKKGESRWFDDVTTPDIIEERDDIIERSILDACDAIIEKYGERESDWSWGQIHRIVFDHALGKKKPLDIIFNIGPYELGGSETTINNAAYSFNSTFDVILGPSMRKIVDFANIDSALSIITTGQSGQPADKHYRDQAPLWVEGKYHRALMNHDQIKNGELDLVQFKAMN